MQSPLRTVDVLDVLVGGPWSYPVLAVSVALDSVIPLLPAEALVIIASALGGTGAAVRVLLAAASVGDRRSWRSPVARSRSNRHGRPDGRGPARFGAGAVRAPRGTMVSVLRGVISPRWFLGPMGRLALITFAWNHRHEVFRWGRSLWEQLIGRGDVSPARALRTGMLLYAIASDDELRNAKQLRKVTMVDDVVDLAVDPAWPELDRLVARVRSVKGVARVTVNGAIAGSVQTSSR